MGSCLDAASKSKFKSTPPTEEECACTWDHLARAFPVEEHALLFDYFEAWSKSIADEKALFPDEAAHMASLKGYTGKGTKSDVAR